MILELLQQPLFFSDPLTSQQLYKKNIRFLIFVFEIWVEEMSEYRELIYITGVEEGGTFLNPTLDVDL